MKRKIFATFGMLAGLVWLGNSSLLVRMEGRPLLVAHRALGQVYDRNGLTNQTCTAARILPAGHEYLENTIPSMRAAFELGADIVEFDVHWTTDKKFAVFHDWTLECRTQGKGVVREHSMPELRKLDVGYGYTADGGKTWPLRGKGVGMMPEMEEVLAAFPDKAFLINIKSNDANEGALLGERLETLARNHSGELMVYGGDKPIAAVSRRVPGMRTMSPPQLKDCLLRYEALGWTGYIPASCRSKALMVPVNIAPWLWGWPSRFMRRMEGAGSLVMVVGHYGGGGMSSGLDDPAELGRLPANYSGAIWTDRLDLIAPAVRARLLQK